MSNVTSCGSSTVQRCDLFDIGSHKVLAAVKKSTKLASSSIALNDHPKELLVLHIDVGHLQGAAIVVPCVQAEGMMSRCHHVGIVGARPPPR